MDPRNLYILRYRRGSTGVITSYLTASNLKIAEALGQFWCNQQLNCRYIRVEPAIVADESILPNLAELKAPAVTPSAVAKARRADGGDSGKKASAAA